MREVLAGLLLAVLMPLMATADCCCCCETAEAESPATEPVSKATAPAIPLPEEMQSFDGSAAPYAVSLPATRFAVYKGSLANPMEAWNSIVPLAAAQGILNDQALAWSIVPRMPDSAPPAATTEYWSAFTIGDSVHPANGLSAYTSPGGKYAMAAHRGPYEGLGDTWGKFAAFIGHNANIDPARPALEHYHSDPSTTAPEDLITLLCIPIK
jgi:AraC family transcriptional regulator